MTKKSNQKSWVRRRNFRPPQTRPQVSATASSRFSLLSLSAGIGTFGLAEDLNVKATDRQDGPNDVGDIVKL